MTNSCVKATCRGVATGVGYIGIYTLPQYIPGYAPGYVLLANCKQYRRVTTTLELRADCDPITPRLVDDYVTTVGAYMGVGSGGRMQGI